MACFNWVNYMVLNYVSIKVLLKKKKNLSYATRNQLSRAVVRQAKIRESSGLIEI
jgi:uncharacterized protein YdeI (YjbR/CyaY-like superfamily)